ncbi:lytic polysaccharide monooxygenase [Plesiomonas sp.]|uniref:lytic polysaccharide monooxygenase n=1 Tax=Plesiomonas sp. TaxID=2486279 RepID=UPI003F4035C3
MKNLKPILFALSSLTVSLASINVHAHGYMVSPQDYANSCHEGTTTAPGLCNDKVWSQRNEISQGGAAGNHKAVLMDGKICSASKGGEYEVLDVPSPQRYSTKLKRDKDGKIEIQYMITAPHRTWYWDYFVTRDGFNPDTDQLTWNDLERIDVIDGKGITPSGPVYTQKINWPANKTGKRILFQIWQRPNPSHTPHEVLGAAPSNVWDSAEAFYSCANVIVEPDDGSAPNPPATESPWLSNEPFASASTAVDVGYTVVARLMDRGSEQFKVPLDITVNNIVDDQWKIELAEKINNTLSINNFAKVGVIDSNNKVILNADPNLNYIYFTNRNWSHLIESHNNEKPEVAFSVVWPSNEQKYEFSPNQPLLVPFSLKVTEQSRLMGTYTYTAIVKEVGAVNQDPVQTLSGPVPNNGVSTHITVKKAGTYSVNAVVTNGTGTSQSTMYSFDVVVKDLPPVTTPGKYDYIFPNGLNSYVAGTKVKANDGKIYECKPWPYSGYCKQWSTGSRAYEPGVGFAWQQAWILK